MLEAVTAAMVGMAEMAETGTLVTLEKTLRDIAEGPTVDLGATEGPEVMLDKQAMPVTAHT